MYTIAVLSGAHVILILAVVIIIMMAGYFLINAILNYQKDRNRMPDQNNNQQFNTTSRPESSLKIPETCPFCNRPNTRRTRLCEWCGEQIC